MEKNFIDEISRLMIDWIHESPLKNMAFKAIMVLLRLLWQKPSRKSKSKNHFKSLENQMELWHVEEIMELVKEIETTQKDLRISNTPSTITKISKKFTREMSRGKSIMWWYWWRWYSFIKWSNLKSDEVKTPTWQRCRFRGIATRYTRRNSPYQIPFDRCRKSKENNA